MIFPNLYILLKMYLCVPIANASAERSFSKLKLIKTYLRSVMGSEGQNNLAVLNIEHEITMMIDFSEIFAEFSNMKARKKLFYPSAN